MPTQEEQEEERQLIIGFVEKNKYAPHNSEIIKLQEGNDDGKADGIIKYDGKREPVEARRKGYPNHKGYVSSFLEKGWDSPCLVDGIFLNESTIRNHKDEGFIFIVKIKGSKPRFCDITPLMIEELLKQPERFMKSTNSGSKQSVKTVPLNWFKEY
jgi:hypothetical protein